MLREAIDRQRLQNVSPRSERTEKVLMRLAEYERNRPRGGLHDEEVWTLLVIYGFVAGDAIHDLGKLAGLLTGGDVTASPSKLWLEMLTVPPRGGSGGPSERPSQIDLSAGHLGRRRKGGVEYQKPRSSPGWVNMTEFKWRGDIDPETTHDFNRNQLARVIETALTFQQPGNSPCYPDAVHVTLLTPAIFKPSNGSGSGSRLYAYKFNEYWRDGHGVQVDRILADINSAKVCRRRDHGGWRYPDLNVRAGCLKLHWITYEQLLREMPDSQYKQCLASFLDREPRKVLQLDSLER